MHLIETCVSEGVENGSKIQDEEDPETDHGVGDGYADRLMITCYGPTGRARLRITRDIASRAIREDERAIVRQAYLDATRDAPSAQPFAESGLRAAGCGSPQSE